MDLVFQLNVNDLGVGRNEPSISRRDELYVSPEKDGLLPSEEPNCLQTITPPAIISFSVSGFCHFKARLLAALRKPSSEARGKLKGAERDATRLMIQAETRHTSG